MPKVDDLSKTYFLKLAAPRRARKTAQRQFLLAVDQTRHHGLEAQEGHRVHPAGGVRRLDRIESLPPAKLIISKQTLGKKNGENWMSLTIENKGDGVAFMIHPRVTRGKGGEDVTPIIWSDNYFSLLPGESRS